MLLHLPFESERDPAGWLNALFILASRMGENWKVGFADEGVVFMLPKDHFFCHATYHAELMRADLERRFDVDLAHEPQLFYGRVARTGRRCTLAEIYRRLEQAAPPPDERCYVLRLHGEQAERADFVVTGWQTILKEIQSRYPTATPGVWRLSVAGWLVACLQFWESQGAKNEKAEPVVSVLNVGPYPPPFGSDYCW